MPAGYSLRWVALSILGLACTSCRAGNCIDGIDANRLYSISFIEPYTPAATSAKFDPVLSSPLRSCGLAIDAGTVWRLATDEPFADAPGKVCKCPRSSPVDVGVATERTHLGRKAPCEDDVATSAAAVIRQDGCQLTWEVRLSGSQSQSIFDPPTPSQLPPARLYRRLELVGELTQECAEWFGGCEDVWVVSVAEVRQ
jgi:hypothetical protein